MKSFNALSARLVMVAVGLMSAPLPAAEVTPPPMSPGLPQATPAAPPQPAPAVVPTAAPAPAPATPQDPNAIAWDADSKEYNAKPGEQNAPFTFYLTNVSSHELEVKAVVTSCGCTTAKLPPLPWKIAAGSNGEINVNLNIAGKVGTVVKTVTVAATTGSKSLTVKANIPVPSPESLAAANRGRNMELAKADRQAVFKGDCVQCHATPTVGKSGKELFYYACAICHEPEHRNEMVSDLRAPNHPTEADYWRQFITAGGKEGGLMPAFAQEQGGPLTREQIDSLVAYLSTDFSKDPKTVYHAPVPPPNVVSPFPAVPAPGLPRTNNGQVFITPAARILLSSTPAAAKNDSQPQNSATPAEDQKPNHQH